jgi:hypothetical protein
MGVGLDDEQAEQLLSLVSGLETLYELVSKIYDRFSDLDTDEE